MQSSTPIEISRARSNDLEAIVGLHIASWRAAYRGIIPDAILDGLDPTERLRQWTRLLADGSRYVAIARIRGQVVGFCSSEPARDEDLDGGVAEIAAIYVAPGFWSQGAGRAMLAAELSRLAALDVRSLVLWVLEGNARALRFYRAAGFLPDGARRFALGEHQVPEVRLRKSVRDDA